MAGSDAPDSVKLSSTILILGESFSKGGKILLIPELEDKKTVATAIKSTMHIS